MDIAEIPAGAEHFPGEDAVRQDAREHGEVPCLPAAVHVAGERSRQPSPLPQAQTRRLFRQNQEQTPN